MIKFKPKNHNAKPDAVLKATANDKQTTPQAKPESESDKPVADPEKVDASENVGEPEAPPVEAPKEK